MIYKIPGLHALCIKIVDFLNHSAYKKQLKKPNIVDVKSFKNCAKSSHKRCFIVGNGPSLTMEDLDFIAKEDSFASNLIFRVFDKTKWRPKYYFIQDPYADVRDELQKMGDTNLFLGDSFVRKRKDNDFKYSCFKTNRCVFKPKFSADLSKGIISHYTITYTMIQAAIYMGYKEIYLLGIDHNYQFTVDKRGKVIKQNVQSHIFEDKNPKEVVANLEGINQAYIKSRDELPKYNCVIFNCTRGGKLEWFPRKKLEEVLK
jgi:hypothetical protein